MQRAWKSGPCNFETFKNIGLEDWAPSSDVYVSSRCRVIIIKDELACI